MVDIVFVDVFHAKVVNHKGEQYVLCLVFHSPSGHLSAFVVSMRRKLFAQQFVCYNPCLRETPYSSLHLKVNVTFDNLVE